MCLICCDKHWDLTQGSIIRSCDMSMPNPSLVPCSAEAIAATAQSVAPVLDVRIVNDKFTGQPRGFAFVHFASIADAARVLHAFNVRALLRVCCLMMLFCCRTSGPWTARIINPIAVRFHSSRPHHARTRTQEMWCRLGL